MLRTAMISLTAVLLITATVARAEETTEPTETPG